MIILFIQGETIQTYMTLLYCELTVSNHFVWTVQCYWSHSNLIRRTHLNATSLTNWIRLWHENKQLAKIQKPSRTGDKPSDEYQSVGKVYRAVFKAFGPQLEPSSTNGGNCFVVQYWWTCQNYSQRAVTTQPWGHKRTQKNMWTASIRSEFMT